MAADLEEAAKTEEIRFVKIFDFKGGEKTFHRYDLPYVAEGLRKQAEFLQD